MGLHSYWRWLRNEWNFFPFCLALPQLPLLPSASPRSACSLLYNIFFCQRVTSGLWFSSSICSSQPPHLPAVILPSLPHWTSSVILPILLPLTGGMTKTASHLLQAHLHPLYKCIWQPLLCETEYIEWYIFLMTQGHVREHQLLFHPTQL